MIWMLSSNPIYTTSKFLKFGVVKASVTTHGASLKLVLLILFIRELVYRRKVLE